MEQEFSRSFYQCWKGTIRILVEELGAVERRQLEVSNLCNERIERIRPADVDAPLAPNISVRTRRH
jgi:hypothetical protein